MFICSPSTYIASRPVLLVRFGGCCFCHQLRSTDRGLSTMAPPCRSYVTMVDMQSESVNRSIALWNGVIYAAETVGSEGTKCCEEQCNHSGSLLDLTSLHFKPLHPSTLDADVVLFFVANIWRHREGPHHACPSPELATPKCATAGRYFIWLRSAGRCHSLCQT